MRSKTVYKVLIAANALGLAFSMGVLPAQAALTFTATAVTSDDNVTINGVAASVYAIAAATTTGTITVGGTAQEGATTIGQSTVTNTISLGNAATADAQTQTINIGAGTPAGTGKATIAIGNTGGATAVTIAAGTGNITLNSTTVEFTKEVNHTLRVATSTTAATAGGNLIVSSAAGNGAASGDLTLQSAAMTSQNSGAVLVTSGATTIAGTTGGVTVKSANSPAASGNVAVGSGNAVSAASGTLTLSSGTTTTSGTTGNVSLASGNAITTGSNSGSVTIDAGSSDATVGSLLIGTTNANTITIGRAGATTVSVTDNNWSVTAGGAATFVSVNKLTLTQPATTAVLTIAEGKTLTASNTLTFTGNDGSTLAVGAGGTLGTGAYATIADYALLASPVLVTPNIGVATATSVNKLTLTAPTTSAVLTIADGKTLTANATLTFAGTDGQTMTFPAASTTVAGLGTAQTFTAQQTFTTATAEHDTLQLVPQAGGAGRFNGKLTSADLTGADKTWTFPNVDGTVVTSGDTDSVTSTMITDATVASVDMSAGAKTNSVAIPLPDPGAGDADITAGYILWKPSVAVTITKLYLVPQVAYAGVDGSNTVVTVVTGTGAVATLTTTTNLAIGTANDMGAITNAAVAADGTITIAVTAGTTADVPAQTLLIEYTTTN